MPGLMENVVALHDIGKPIAIRQGKKSAQHSKTLPILEEQLWSQGYQDKDVSLAKALVGNDVLESLIRGKVAPDAVFNKLKALSDQAGVSLQDFAALQASLYKSDAGAYPEVADSIFFKGPIDRFTLPDVNFGILEEMIYGQVFESPWLERVGEKGKGSERSPTDRGGIG
ncbi:MAG: hypothetical protein ACYC6Y_10405 [Thermoguttaceae bacterium]